MRKTVNNALYKTTIRIGAGKFRQVSWYFCNALIFRNSLVVSSGLKVFLLRMFGARVGKGVLLKPSVNIKFPWKLEIGNHCWIGEGVWIDNLSEVKLGNSVTLSQGALLLTGSHDHTRQSFDFMSSGISLEDGVWIGAKAVVMGGVTCHSHAILGVSSVAARDLEAYTIYQGNPSIPVLERLIY